MKMQIGFADGKRDDSAVAMKLWTDLRWAIQTTAASHEDILQRIDQAIETARKEIKTLAVRVQIVKRFEQMKNRVLEANGEAPVVVCCSCGMPIPEGMWRKEVPSEIAGLVVCEKCSAAP